MVFFGSFDPPHRGHAALLTAAAKRIRPGRIFIIPAYLAPFKKGHTAKPADRLAMLRCGLLPHLPQRWRRIARIDAREVRSRRRVYTVETLEQLKAERPDRTMHCVVGSDSAKAWTSWRAPKRLARLCRWWTAPRPNTSLQHIPRSFSLIRRPMPDICSTDIRADLAAGLDVSQQLHPDTDAFIRRRGLYGTDILLHLKRGLKPGRFVHTLAVRALAAALARRWGEDVRRASRAAILHDCGLLIKKDRLAAYARMRRLAVPALAQIIRRQPRLLHAWVGAALARRRLGCRDIAVLNAVRRHTLGAPGMSRLDLILYVADAVSLDRNHPEAARLRRLAFKDLDAAFAACLSVKLSHALKRRAWLHPLSIRLWNLLCDQRS